MNMKDLKSNLGMKSVGWKNVIRVLERIGCVVRRETKKTNTFGVV